MDAIDEIDRHLLVLLSRDARLSLKELAGAVGLSSPSVSERIRRLEERGVILGYAAEIDPVALGYQMEAIIRVKPMPGKLHLVQGGALIQRRLPA